MRRKKGISNNPFISESFSRQLQEPKNVSSARISKHQKILYHHILLFLTNIFPHISPVLHLTCDLWVHHSIKGSTREELLLHLYDVPTASYRGLYCTMDFLWPQFSCQETTMDWNHCSEERLSLIFLRLSLSRYCGVITVSSICEYVLALGVLIQVLKSCQ